MVTLLPPCQPVVGRDAERRLRPCQGCFPPHVLIEMNEPLLPTRPSRVNV